MDQISSICLSEQYDHYWASPTLVKWHKCRVHKNLLYTAKLSSGKTFAVFCSTANVLRQTG